MIWWHRQAVVFLLHDFASLQIVLPLQFIASDTQQRQNKGHLGFTHGSLTDILYSGGVGKKRDERRWWERGRKKSTVPLEPRGKWRDGPCCAQSYKSDKKVNNKMHEGRTWKLNENNLFKVSRREKWKIFSKETKGEDILRLVIDFNIKRWSRNTLTPITQEATGFFRGLGDLSTGKARKK